MSERKILIAGNWKMNGLTKDAVELAGSIGAKIDAYGSEPSCEFLVCPPMTQISTVAEIVEDTMIAVGGQDCHFAEKGAHTGDTSPFMLKDAGCDFVIVGHSERRTNHGETDETVLNKAKLANTAGLKAVICIGETEAEKDAGKTIDVCKTQINGSVPSDATAENTVVAYEPVWAIGTGRTPTSEDVQATHKEIRAALAAKIGAEADKVQILYGGSVKPSNAKEFLSLPDVDGALIGGASLKAEDFWAIAEATF